MIVTDLTFQVYSKAINAFMKGSFSEALRQFKYCIEHDYEVRESYFYLGCYHYYTLQFQEAFIYQQLVISGDNHHSGAYYYLGLMCKEMENISDALIYYKKSIDYATDSLYPLLSFLDLRENISPTSLRVYQQKAYQMFAIQLEFVEQEKLYIDALSAWGKENYDTARGLLTKAQEQDPKSFHTYWYLAKLYFELGDYEKSKDNWMVLHRKFDLDKLGLKYLAKIEKNRENYRKSIAYLRNYLDFFKNTSYKEYCNLATLYSLAGMIKTAVVYYEKSIALNAQFFPALFNLGVCLQKLGQFDKAIISYERASSIEGSNSIIYYNLGLVYFEQKDYIQSLFNLNKSYQLNPLFTEAKANFNYISFLHMQVDKEFSKKNFSLLITSLILLTILLVVLSIVHFFGVI